MYAEIRVVRQQHCDIMFMVPPGVCWGPRYWCVALHAPQGSVALHACMCVSCTECHRGACMQEVKLLVNQNLHTICNVFGHVPGGAPGTFQNDVVFRDTATLLAARLQVRPRPATLRSGHYDLRLRCM